MYLHAVLHSSILTVLKTAAIWDEEQFAILETHCVELMRAVRSNPSFGNDRLSNVRAKLKQLVLGSVRVKAHIVSADEREGGLRNLLNFGHSIGHAYEGLLTPQILHGECVAIGMVLEANLSRYLGLLSDAAVSRLVKCISAYGLPISPKDPVVQERSGHKVCSTDALMSLMAVDKKNEGKNKRVVLLAAIGATYEKKATAVPDCHIRVILSPAIVVLPPKSMNLRLECTPPGSKSISNRALLLAALGQGSCRLRNLLHSDDTEVMLTALTQMQCATFQWEDDGDVLDVKGKGGRLQAGEKPLYLGNAGTASRFLTTVAAFAKPAKSSASILTGNTRMKSRPIGPLVSALRDNGARINYVEKEGSLPIEIDALGGIDGGEIELAATISSQYVSSLLMCAPYARHPTSLSLVGGKPISQPYIDMTIAMMADFGIAVTKSSKREHTYHIPQGQYSSPREYYIESDASSATYPLAIAAITGTSCTIPNIGSTSLQGDARFAVDILRPMGCLVEQTATSTTVTGTVDKHLRPLPDIDMEAMTDAFLTASMLAAVAQSPDGCHKTRITGIANQRVKECNRIKAIADQLAKFGVRSREFEDGLEIHGVPSDNLVSPTDGVECYDDHRVAMSFSVLAMKVPTQTLIRDKDCVGKTWPSWWDTLSQIFHVDLEGFDINSSHETRVDDCREPQKSIYIIGMRGAGKTTCGNWAGQILRWPFVDLDSQLETMYNISVSEFIETRGWDDFRSAEIALLNATLENKPWKHIFACGGGIVEKPEARQRLQDYQKSGGIVLLVNRDIEDVMTFLQVDNTRPAYEEDIRVVWCRRQPWFQECSNFEYFSQNSVSTSVKEIPSNFRRFLESISGRRKSLSQILKKENSCFVSLTMPNISETLPVLDEVIVGSDAVELRVDLLHDPRVQIGPPSGEFIAQQLAMLREVVDLPIIFTLRTTAQGGSFPNNNPETILALYMQALRMGVEFLDLELHNPVHILETVVKYKRHSKIIASHHDPRGDLTWADGSWVPFYNKALQYGDVIKLVGSARGQADNISLASFRSWAQAAHSTPMIAVNMGVQGQLSRIQNSVLTPVSHPALPFKAAPGQLSASEIRLGLSLHGVIVPRTFYLLGSPVSMSRSPVLHNTLFRSVGLPYSYKVSEAKIVQDAAIPLQAADFGGASITIPLKLDIMSCLDEIDTDARLIGAVNTIVVDSSRQGTHGRQYLTGKNTDWQGMALALSKAGAKQGKFNSAVIVGGGGTARAAIFALHEMGYSPLYMIGRSLPKLQIVTDSFPKHYNLIILENQRDIENLQQTPCVLIGTIPAHSPIDMGIRESLRTLFKARKGTMRNDERIMLEMAYEPRRTALMQLAEGAGWKTIPGLEVLVAQGFYQVCPQVK